MSGGGGFESIIVKITCSQICAGITTCWKKYFEQIVVNGCTGFPTDLHDTIWMEVNNKEHYCCGERGQGVFSPQDPQEPSLTVSMRSVQTAIPWR